MPYWYINNIVMCRLFPPLGSSHNIICMNGIHRDFKLSCKGVKFRHSCFTALILGGSLGTPAFITQNNRLCSLRLVWRAPDWTILWSMLVKIKSIRVLECSVILVGLFIAELPRPKGPLGTEHHWHHGKSKETHEFIFSWLPRLAVLLVGAYARRRRRRRRRRSRATWRP